MNLFHYCPNSSFVSIIKSQSIWLSDLSLSNDHLEGKWVRRIFAKSCEDAGLEKHKIQKLLEHMDGLIKIAGAAGFCVSQEPDLLSQWRGYADKGAGVSIGFAKEYLEKLSKGDPNRKIGFSLQQIEYIEAKQIELIKKETDNILKYVAQGSLNFPRVSLLSIEDEETKKKQKKAFHNMSFSFLLFFPHLYTLKNPAFREENEWRLIGILPQGHKETDVGMLSDLEYREANDHIIPYFTAELADIGIPPITEIVLGPRNMTPTKVVYGLLEKYGFEDVSVRTSDASLR